MAPSMAPTVLQRTAHASRQFPAGADGEGGIKGGAETKKAAYGCLFCFQCIHAWRGSTALAQPSAARDVGWHGWVRLTGTVSGMDAAAKPPGVRALCLRSTASLAPERTAASGWAGPRRGVHGVSRAASPTRALQQTDTPAGNALNLTAPRRYPPRPCRCRCTWSPCRTSAGDDAGRAAGWRCGSRRSRPAGGPRRSRRPAG